MVQKGTPIPSLIGLAGDEAPTLLVFLPVLFVEGRIADDVEVADKEDVAVNAERFPTNFIKGFRN
jgi:hypothetical protein